MELKELKEFAFECIDKARNKGLSEFSLTTDDFSITIKNATEVHNVCTSAPQPVASITVTTEEKEPEVTGTPVTAPIVGTFYSAPSPDDAPFVSVGQEVKTGDTLFIIEAMKTMNEIVSPCDGKVSRIYAQNGDLIEYKQVVVVIE